LGSGRVGRCASGETLATLVDRVKNFLRIDGLHVVGDLTRVVRQVGVGCGSAGSFLGAARKAGCDVLLTGETNFHTCLEAEATGVALILPGHYASERFGLERLADELVATFPGLTIWASRREHDPLAWR
jgi:putative NIF3 family GTP cyclohydrolase 1 type 2